MSMDTTGTHRLDFVLIGAQKCATSWMYYCLGDHPEIALPNKKLEAGYIGGPMFAEKGEDWFFDRFQDDKKLLRGDISVEYLYDLSTPEALKPYVSGPKFILSLRDPVDRMVSNYFWLVRRGKIDNLPLEEGISKILDQPKGFTDKIDGPLEEVVRRSCYGPQIRNYNSHFGSDGSLVVLYENVAADGWNTLKEIYSFLGVDPNFRPKSLNSAPKRNTYNKLLLSIENKVQFKPVAKLINYANQAIAAVRPPADILPEKLRVKLDDLFAPTIDETISVLETMPTSRTPSSDEIRRLWQRSKQ